jgi:hypothetical protein
MTPIEPESRRPRMVREHLERRSSASPPRHQLLHPGRMLALAYEVGFTEVRHVTGSLLAERHLAGRTDDLRPSGGEDLLVATT